MAGTSVAGTSVTGTSVTGAQLSAAPACSDWARSQDLSPIGSAGHYQGYLLVEVPLPWPAEISEVAELAGVAELALRAGLRLQAIAPGATPAPASGRRTSPAGSFITERHGPDGRGRSVRRERLVGPGAGPWPETVAELLAPPDGQADSPATVRPSVARTVTAWWTSSCARTAGGTPAAEAGDRPCPGVGRGWSRRPRAAAPGLQGAAATGPRPRSACGAPATPGATALPPRRWCCPPPRCGPGLTWTCSDRVVGAHGPLSEVVGRYRGCATLGPPAHQAVERSVLAEVGWPLLSSWRLSPAWGTVG